MLEKAQVVCSVHPQLEPRGCGEIGGVGYVEGQDSGQEEQSTKEMRLERSVRAGSHRALNVALGNLGLVLWAVASWVY